MGIGGAAADLAGGAVAGAAVGIGDQIGLPRTDTSRCQAALAAGDTYTASLYCPASTFVSQAGIGGVIAAGAEGMGSMIGIPQTNMTECERAKAEGRTLDASFACPGSDFLSYINPFN